MRAWLTAGDGHAALRAEEVPVPVPGPDELLVRVGACGVCRTDLHVADGDLPLHGRSVVPGHEVVGRVVAVGDDVPTARVGERVGIAWLRSTCGTCRWCRRGAENLCPGSQYTGWDADGGYAEYAVAPAAYVYRAPEGLEDLQARAVAVRRDHRTPGPDPRGTAARRAAGHLRVRGQRPPDRPGRAGAGGRGPRAHTGCRRPGAGSRPGRGLGGGGVGRRLRCSSTQPSCSRLPVSSCCPRSRPSTSREPSRWPAST